MGFSRQEYGSGLPCPPPGGLSDPGIDPGSPALRADSLPSEPPGRPSTVCATTRAPECLSYDPAQPEKQDKHLKRLAARMNLRGSRAAFLSHGEANMLDQLTLVWGRPVLCRMFSRSSDASGAHSPQVCQPEASPDVTRCPRGTECPGGAPCPVAISCI